jgi:RimJ/RimL family protein N-acetyltransferase
LIRLIQGVFDMHNLHEIPGEMETERLCMRSYQSGDGPLLFAVSVRNREHLAEFESGNVLMDLKSETHAETTARELAGKWAAHECYFIGLFEKETNEWVGQVYVGPTNRELPEFTLGYVADVRHEGKGYISEGVRRVLKMLFEDLDAHRVRSECDENNVRSMRLLERCGFIREAHLRENKRSADGSFHGDYLYALLRREYYDR